MTAISPTFVSRVLEARHRLYMRGIAPERLFVSVEDWPDVMSVGVAYLMDMRVEAAPESAVAGRPRHGRYQIVAYEREPV